MSPSYRRLALLLCVAAPLSADEFSTYIGNASADFQVARAVSDSAGNTYIAGNRIYNSWILSGFQVSTVFVMKLDATGRTVLYATLGGSGSDSANDLAVDAAGNIYVAGATSSPVFPIHNALQSAPGRGFLVKLNQDATQFIWSTYFPEAIRALAVDATGNVYVAGTTTSSGFPVTPGISYGHVNFGVPAAASGAFLTKISAAGDRIVYSSVIAGSSKPCGGGSSCFLSFRSTSAAAVAVDPQGNAYLAGNTETNDLPTTPGALTPLGTGAFAMKINAAGTAIAYLTYIGPTNYTYTPFVNYANSATAIAVDTTGSAYVVGSTFDPNFPATAGAYQTAFSSPLAPYPWETPADAFAVKLNGSGGAVWATYLGRQGADAASSVAVDSSGNAWVSGTTTSANFPNAQGWIAGGEFVVGFNASGSALSYAARYPAGTVAQSIATDPGGFLHLAGPGGLISTMRPGQPPVERVFGVANAAFGGLQGIIAPGEVISIYGPRIGPAAPVSAAPDSSGMFPKSLGGVQVSIGGIAAPLLYASESRIDAVVPLSLATTGPAAIQVTVNGAALPYFTASGAQADPQVFQNVDGSAAAINQDNTINSADHPAQPGSIVAIWATGTERPAFNIQDGQVVTAAQDYSCCFVVFETSASEATPVNVYYAGAAPGLVAGLTQINFQVPPSGSTFRVGAGDSISEAVRIYVTP